MKRCALHAPPIQYKYDGGRKDRQVPLARIRVFSGRQGHSWQEWRVAKGLEFLALSEQIKEPLFPIDDYAATDHE